MKQLSAIFFIIFYSSIIYNFYQKHFTMFFVITYEMGRKKIFRPVDILNTNVKLFLEKLLCLHAVNVINSIVFHIFFSTT